MENLYVRNNIEETILVKDGLTIIKSVIRSELDLINFIADCANVCGSYAQVKDVRNSLDATAIPFYFYYVERCKPLNTVITVVPTYKKCMNAKTLFTNARSLMNEDEVVTYASSGSDLFLKQTKVSKMLISLYSFKENVCTFADEVDHEPWYAIPFACTNWWEDRGMPCGEIQKEYLFK